MDYLLTEHFDVSGDWFLPNQRDWKVGGTLSWKADGARLKLNDQLDDPPKGTMTLGIDTFDAKYQAVHGITNSSEAVTALDTRLAGYSLQSGSSGVLRVPLTLHCNTVVVGGYVGADTKYTEMLFRVPGLEAWSSTKSIYQNVSDGKINLSTAKNLDEVINLNELDSELILRTGHRANVGAHSASIKTSGYFGLRPREPQSLSWFFDQTPKITNLLTLLAGAPMSIDQMLAKTGPSEPSFSVLKRQFGEKYCDYNQQREFFVSRSEVTDFSRLWTNWLFQYEKVKEACSLAISVLTVDDLWTNVQFLSLMQALEGLHRALFDGTYMSANTYEGVRDAIIKSIPDGVSSDHRDALRARIEYGNEWSLKKRITSLVARLPNEVRRTALGEIGSVPQKWIDTRNYYTHWDEKLRPQILGLEEMYYAGVRLKLLLRALYLQLAGVSDETMVKAMGNNSEVSRQIRYLNQASR